MRGFLYSVEGCSVAIKRKVKKKNIQHYTNLLVYEKSGAIYPDTYDKFNLQCIASLIQDLIGAVSA